MEKPCVAPDPATGNFGDTTVIRKFGCALEDLSAC